LRKRNAMSANDALKINVLSRSQSQLPYFCIHVDNKTSKCSTYMSLKLLRNASKTLFKTRRALGRVHLPPTKVLKQRLALAARRQYVYVGFFRRKINRSSAAPSSLAAYRQGCKVPYNLYDIGESNPVPASRLWSGSGSKVDQFVHVPTFCRHAAFHPNPYTRGFE